MKVLLVHDEYNVHGGEDIVVEAYYEDLKEAGCNVKLYQVSNEVIFNMSKVDKLKLFIRNLRMNRLSQDLLEVIETYSPDIIHVHNVFPLITPRIYYEASIRNIKIVQTLHNYRFICPDGLLFCRGEICEKCIEKKNLFYCFYLRCYRNSYLLSLWYSLMIRKSAKKGWFKRIDRYIALTQFTVDKMVESGFDEKNFTIVPNGMAKYKKGDDIVHKDYILYMGRLSAEKGILDLLEAIGHTNYELFIAGGGALEGKIQPYLTERIRYLGYVKGREKERLIEEARVVVVPSKCYENLPTVVIEAFASGVPAIVSNLGGLAYMVEDGFNGYCYNPNNESELIQKLNLIFSHEHYAQLCEGAKLSFERQYDKNIEIRKMLDIYNSLLDK